MPTCGLRASLQECAGSEQEACPWAGSGVRLRAGIREHPPARFAVGAAGKSRPSFIGSSFSQECGFLAVRRCETLWHHEMPGCALWWPDPHWPPQPGRLPPPPVPRCISCGSFQKRYTLSESICRGGSMTLPGCPGTILGLAGFGPGALGTSPLVFSGCIDTL